MSKVIQLTKDSFEPEVLKSELPVLVDFWAPWCQPCLMMAPVLESLSDEMADQLKVAKINTEIPENQIFAIQYQIRSIPNMKLFKDGKVVREFIGLRPKSIFKAELEQALKEINS